MQKHFTLVVGCCLLFSNINAQISFTNANSRLTNSNFHSGVAITVNDMNGDGLDDICRMDQGHIINIQYQQPGGGFTSVSGGDIGGGSAWAMVVGDIDNNGMRDIASDGQGGIRIVKANSDGTSYTMTTLANSTWFLQNANFADVDLDGDIDFFGCDDNAASHIYLNNGSGVFTETTTLINFNVTPSDDSGNYGSSWSDFDNDGDIDLYIAKCRQGVNSSSDWRRRNMLFVNNGNGTFTADTGNVYGLRDGAQTWTAQFGDYDNDGDLDLVETNHDVASKIFQNNGSGYFTDVTSSTGFNTSGITPIQSVWEDFDNDGYLDILVTGSSHRMWKNNGNGTFTNITSTVFNNNNMESFAIGDLNHDGKIDIYGGYANIYTTPTSVDDVFWLNTTQNDNHFICFNLQGTVSSRDALGARVTLYGPWGIQIREVRAGESYGTCNSFTLHFGLGASPQIDSAVVRFPSGIKHVLINPTPDQYITVIENDCVSPDNVISPAGSVVLCTGQSTTLTANSGTNYSYLWSNGETTQSINVTTPGEYWVKISVNGSNCSSISAIKNIQVSPDETPTVTAAGELQFCEGGSVVLSSSSASSYSWTGGGNTQSITVTQSGSYTVTIQGACQTFTSNPVVVNVIPSNVSNINAGAACEGNPITLSGTGTGDVYWYDDAAGTNVVGTGNSITVNIPSTATYYVQSFDTILGFSGFVGAVDSAIGSGGYYSNNQAQIFNVLKPVILKTVKVYCGSAGNRTIELRTSGGTVLQSVTVNLPQGMSIVPLNFNIPVGNNYRLGWPSGSQPDWWRNSSGATYPYQITNLISITGNTANDLARWYAYYNWEVEEAPITCASTIVPVVATVNPNPVVTFSGLNAVYLETDAPATLIGSPAGGTFSGPGVSGNTFNPAAAGWGGPYTITYTYIDANGCSGTYTMEVTVSKVDDVVEIEGLATVSVFPNPSHGSIYLQPAQATHSSISTQLTDITGRVVFERTVTFNGTAPVSVNDTTLPAGNYLLKLSNESGNRVVSIIFQ